MCCYTTPPQLTIQVWLSKLIRIMKRVINDQKSPIEPFNKTAQGIFALCSLLFLTDLLYSNLWIVT